MIINRNDTCHFMSKRRAVFLAWKDHTKRTVAFCRTLRHVIENTLWHQGFQNIKEFSRDKALTRNQNSSLQRLRKMFSRRNCGAAFSRWKSKEFQVAMEGIEFINSEVQKGVDTYDKQLDTIKDHNGDKYERHLGNVTKHKVMQQWKAITKMLKAHRNAKKSTLESFSGYQQVRAIRKWIERVRATKFARDRIAKYNEIRSRLYKQAVFGALQSKYQRAKALCLRLANMAEKFDNLSKQSAFQMIQNFKLAKDRNFNQRKKVAATDAFSLLHKLYLNRMTK